MGAESEPKSEIEYRRTLLGRLPLRGWTPLGKGLYIHTEEVSYAILTQQPRIITSVYYGEGETVVISDMVYNKYLKTHEIRQTAFSQHDIEAINNFTRTGLVPRQFRRSSS